MTRQTIAASLIAAGFLASSYEAMVDAREQLQWKPPSESLHWSVPRKGLVPNPSTAVRIAQAILPSLQSGAKELRQYQPWYARAVADAWEVRGTLPKYTIGGTFVIVIARSDGRIVFIYHEQ